MNLEETALWTALVTPMKENGEPDAEDLASLIHRQDEAGNGVLLLGSTGEGLALSLEDKKNVVETASSLIIDIPLMAGVGGFNLRDQLEWIEYCQQHVDCLLLVTPLYAKPGAAGQIQWFKTLLNAAESPCILYNVPSRTGVKMNPKVIEELSDHPNLFGLKEASGSLEEYQQFRKAAPELTIYSGDDALTPFFAAAGCRGLVSVMSNVWPEATHRYVDWCLAGRSEELLPLWQECADALFSAPNPVSVKVLLHEKRWIKNAVFRLPLTADDLKNKEVLLKADERIRAWFEKTN